MKNSLALLKAHAWKISTFVFLFLFLAKGCTSNKITALSKKSSENTARLEQKVDSLQAQVAQMSTSKQVRDEVERAMLDFLIYEDDLDKGKTSLSEIKNKIESND